MQRRRVREDVREAVVEVGKAAHVGLLGYCEDRMKRKPLKGTEEEHDRSSSLILFVVPGISRFSKDPDSFQWRRVFGNQD